MLIDVLTTASIDDIFDHISDGSKQEILSLGKTPQQVRNRFYELIDSEFTATILDENKEPMALIALENSGFNTWCGNLITRTGAWEKVGLSITHFFARFSSELVKKTGGVVEAFSPYNAGKWFDWFLVMGFSCCGKDKTGRLYRYIKTVR